MSQSVNVFVQHVYTSLHCAIVPLSNQMFSILTGPFLVPVVPKTKIPKIFKYSPHITKHTTQNKSSDSQNTLQVFVVLKLQSFI